MTPRLAVVALAAAVLVGCYDSRAPVGAARPDAGLRPRPDGGVLGECLPGEAMLRGELGGRPSADPLSAYPFAIAHHRHDDDCTTSRVLFGLFREPPAGRDPTDPDVSVLVFLPEGTDLFAATEPFVGEVEVHVRSEVPFTTIIREAATLRAEPVELGSGRVTLEIERGSEVWGRIDAVYCSTSTCL